jgi:hypothetical protein
LFTAIYANRQRIRAEAARSVAQTAKAEAERLRTEAEIQTKITISQKNLAELSKAETLKQSEIARKNEVVARNKTLLAKANELEARRQAQLANEQKERAEIEKNIANEELRRSKSLENSLANALAVGRLRNNQRLTASPPEAPDSRKISLSNDATNLEKQVARDWNSFGGLLTAISQELGIEPGIALAVLNVDGIGNGFTSNGKMRIYFEYSIFYREWGREHSDQIQQHFTRSDTGCSYRVSPNDDFKNCAANSWEAFQVASNLNKEAALRSISMGRPQILGLNSALAGYESAQEMFNAFSASEVNQIVGGFEFIKNSPKMLAPLRAQSYRDFARSYTGLGPNLDRTVVRLQSVFDTFQRLKERAGSRQR